MRLAVILLLPALLVAEGGIQGFPPFPTELGPELVVDGDLESLANWTEDVCVTLDNTTFEDGANSAKAASCGSGTKNYLRQNITVPADTHATMLRWGMFIKKDSAADGTFGLTGLYNLGGAVTGGHSVAVTPSWDGDGFASLAADGDFIEYALYRALDPRFNGTLMDFRIRGIGQTAGNVWVDAVSFKEAWYPLYNFVKYPNFRGYLWSGFDSQICDGTETDEVCGFVEVRPPEGTDADATHVQLDVDTTADCATPISTQDVEGPTISSTIAVSGLGAANQSQFHIVTDATGPGDCSVGGGSTRVICGYDTYLSAWTARWRWYYEIDGSGWANDSTHYVCAELQLDSDDSVIADFPDWAIVKRTEAWRSANLRNWIDDYQRWIDEDVGSAPQLMRSTYVRTVAANGDTIPANYDTGTFGSTPCGSDPDHATAADCWKHISAGMSTGLLPNGTSGSIGSGTSGQWNEVGDGGSSLFAEIIAQGKNNIIWFAPIAGINPGDPAAEDAYTPYLDALKDLGLHHWQIAFESAGDPITSENSVATSAGTAPTVSCQSTGGSIDDTYVWSKVSAVRGRGSLESSAGMVHSRGSLAGSDGALSGSTNSCTITPPACASNGSTMGWWVYAAVSATASEPANSAFDLQTTEVIPCGGSLDITQYRNTEAVPKTDSTASPGPVQGDNTAAWMTNGDTSHTLWGQWATVHSTKESMLGWYLCDECIAHDAPLIYQAYDWLRTNDKDSLSFAVALQALSTFGQDWFYAPISDINSQDIYHNQATARLEDRWATTQASGISRVVNCPTQVDDPNATTAIQQVWPTRIDVALEDKSSFTEGSRPNLVILQNFSVTTSNTCDAFPLAELRKMIWRTFVGMQNWQILSGIGDWGIISGQGFMDAVRVRGHSDYLLDQRKAWLEVDANVEMLLEPVDDSSQLGWGTVLDTAPTSSITLPTATCKGWTDPIRAVAKIMPNGDQYIMAVNLCSDTQNMTFSLAAEPTGAIAQDVLTGTQYTITTGDFTVSGSTDYDVHVIKIASPKGGGGRGRT